MKIGLRGGHSPNCIGSVGLVNEYEQMQIFYKYVRDILVEHGHIVIDCNSDAPSQNTELREGAIKANNNNVDLFISLHMNASLNHNGYGTECHVASLSSKSVPYAKRICSNFELLGFFNRGIRISSFYEMRNVAAPNIIFELCFCDNKKDINIYNKYSWEELASSFCNAIDSSIPIIKFGNKKKYIVTNYLPKAYEGYDGVDISHIIEKYFSDIKVYLKYNPKGIWIETRYLSDSECRELKNKLGNLYYSTEYEK